MNIKYCKTFHFGLLAFGFLIFQNCEQFDSDEPSDEVKIINVFDSLYTIAQANWSEAMDIQSVRPGGYLIGGRVSINWWNKGFLIKINESGVKSWERIYPGISRIFQVKQASDDGFYACGEDNDSGACLLKTNIYGEMEWYSYVSFPYDDGAIYTHQTSDNHYILLVNSYAVPSRSRVAKIGPDGKKKWVKEIVADSGRSVCYSIHEQSENLVVFCGNINVALEKGWMIILDQNGNEISRRTLDNTLNNLYVQQRKSTVIQTTNGGFAGCGFNSFIEFDQNGAMLHYLPVKPSSLSDYKDAYTRALVELSDGTFLIGGALSGNSISKAALFKIDRNRKVKWRKVVLEDVNADDFVNSICSVGDSCFVVAGWSSADENHSTLAWVKSVKINDEE